MTTAYIGLGANLEAPDRQLQTALDYLDQHSAIVVAAVSRFYRSAPLGPAGQSDYCNAVAALNTQLSPNDLLAALLTTERSMGRQRGERWGPRLIDLDLLLYGDVVLDEPGLTLPHPEMTRRNFVLTPLAELAPALTIPGQGVVAELASKLGDEGLCFWEHAHG